MADLTRDRLRREAEALSEGVARALWQAHAGHAPTAALQPLYARHAAAYGDEALDLAREILASGDAPGDSDRALAEWVAETRVARTLAPLDEREIAWERTAVVRLADGGQMEYGRVPIALANTRERGERLAIEAARAALVAAELAPQRRERLQREHDATAALGLGDDYVTTFARTSGIDVRALSAQAEALLRDTQAMWDDLLPTFARRRLDLPARELTRADLMALFRAPEFDAGFAPGGMVATVRTQLAAMGLDPSAGGRIRYDVGERVGKRARAFCAPVRVPDEVHLVLRPTGGAQDWRTLLHEVGHALHFAHARPDLPFEARWAGDHSVTEGYAMLFDHLLMDRGWLRRYAELEAPRVPEFLRASAFQELYMLRRYAAKLQYELALHASEAWEDAAELYVTTLEAATSARHAAADALVDVDPRLYVVRYLRAWQLQAVLGVALRDRFDEDWWRNPRAGPWLTDTLMREGQRLPAEEIAALAIGAEGGDAPLLGFAPVIAAIETRLG
ncbi:MAG: hypothetical protein ACXW05_02015 [Gemmatirosa sp.]